MSNNGLPDWHTTNDPDSYWKMFNPNYGKAPPPVPSQSQEISAIPNVPPIEEPKILGKNYWQALMAIILIPFWLFVFWPFAVVMFVAVVCVWLRRRQVRANQRWQAANVRSLRQVIERNKYNGNGDIF